MQFIKLSGALRPGLTFTSAAKASYLEASDDRTVPLLERLIVRDERLAADALVDHLRGGGGSNFDAPDTLMGFAAEILLPRLLQPLDDEAVGTSLLVRVENQGDIWINPARGLVTESAPSAGPDDAHHWVSLDLPAFSAVIRGYLPEDLPRARAGAGEAAAPLEDKNLWTVADHEGDNDCWTDNCGGMHECPWARHDPNCFEDLCWTDIHQGCTLETTCGEENCQVDYCAMDLCNSDHCVTDFCAIAACQIDNCAAATCPADLCAIAACIADVSFLPCPVDLCPVNAG